MSRVVPVRRQVAAVALLRRVRVMWPRPRLRLRRRLWQKMMVGRIQTICGVGSLRSGCLGQGMRREWEDVSCGCCLKMRWLAWVELVL